MFFAIAKKLGYFVKAFVTLLLMSILLVHSNMRQSMKLNFYMYSYLLDIMSYAICSRLALIVSMVLVLF